MDWAGRTVILGILSTVFALAHALAQKGGDANERFGQAVRLHQAGDLDGAVVAYQECLKLQPERIDAISNLGVVLARLGRYPEAIRQYQHALALTGDVRIRRNLAIASYKSGMLSDAVRELSVLRESAPGDEQILTLLSDCYFRLGENRKVLELLRPAVSSAPANPAVLYLLGTALIRDNQIAEGQALIDQLLRKGESAEVRFLIGTTQLMGRQYAEVEQTLARAVSLNAGLPELFAYYGLALMKSGKGQAAVTAFRKELERDPGNYAANLNLGCLLRDQKKLDEAVGLLRKAREIRPNEAQPPLELGMAYSLQTRWPEAASALEDAARQDPESIAVHRALTEVYQHMNRASERDAQRVIVQRLEGRDQSDSAIQKLHAQIMEQLRNEK